MELSFKKKRIYLILLILTGAVFSEYLLRTVWGFCNAPLYREDSDYEYIVQPNQDGYRFGHYYHYNSFSQRSEEPDTTRTIVLGLGDSVIFGGIMVDNDSLATTLFSEETGMQMLNISAGSWGPDNCAAYIKKHGIFNAKAIYLIVSSHDAHDNITHEKVVGLHESYPSKQYTLAWFELIHRYFFPRFLNLLQTQESNEDPDTKVLKGMIVKNGIPFNKGFSELKEIADNAGIPFYVCLHPETIELERHKYNEQGIEIINWCKDNNVTLILEMKEGITTEMYRDGIHLNEKGQRFEANLMKKYIHI